MTSTRKQQANRRNTRASTGPRTAAGKKHSAQNARRYGLSVPALGDPTRSENVEALARAIAGEGADANLLDPARRIAEAQFDLMRVRRVRHDQLTCALDNPDYMSNVDLGNAVPAISALTKVNRYRPNAPSMTGSLIPKREGPQKLAFILSDLTEEFGALDRYERRALSRRKFAIRDFDAARCYQFDRAAESKNQTGS